MACIGRQPWQGEKELGALISDIDPGGVDLKVLGHFYKAVAQAVFLFGAEMWLLTPCMKRALDSFQHRVARRLTGRQPRIRGGWELGLPTTGGGNGGVMFRGYQETSH